MDLDYDSYLHLRFLLFVSRFVQRGQYSKGMPRIARASFRPASLESHLLLICRAAIICYNVRETLHDYLSGIQTVEHEIPDIVIGRLPLYLRELHRMESEPDKATTSSHELGERLGISSAQIRKDLSHFGEFGKQGTGYHINYLIERLTEILHLTHEWPVALVGAGFLGHALASYRGFQQRGFVITCVFDSDPAKVGEDVAGLVVQDAAEMEPKLRADGIQIAILAVPAGMAQETADALVAAGVKALLNYAPVSLTVPPGVRVSYSDPVVQLQRMTYHLTPERS
jgi:redox-sensing transcriptional repressor